MRVHVHTRTWHRPHRASAAELRARRAVAQLQPGQGLLLSSAQVDMFRNAMRLGLGQRGSVAPAEPLEKPVNVGAVAVSLPAPARP